VRVRGRAGEQDGEREAAGEGAWRGQPRRFSRTPGRGRKRR
jgi:hypothetical protein